MQIILKSLLFEFFHRKHSIKYIFNQSLFQSLQKNNILSKLCLFSESIFLFKILKNLKIIKIINSLTII
jgi:hypothetical protein